MNKSVFQKMVTWTAGLALILGGINLLFILEPPHRKRAHKSMLKNIPMADSILRVPASLGRLVAPSLQKSFEDNSQQTQLPSSESEEITVSCHNIKTQKIKTTTHQLRLVLENCDSSAGEIEITNLTNGFTATVFQESKNSLATDYISISESSNKIQIQTHPTRGPSSVEEFEVQH